MQNGMPQTDAGRTLRVDPDTVRNWLNRLDQATTPSSTLDMRASERFTYRPDRLTLQLDREHETVELAAAGRNLSREGVSLLTGRFVYPRTLCHVKLAGPFNGQQRTAGQVKWCRYLPGSGTLHEIGIEFKRAVDVALFAPHAEHLEILLLDEATATHQLLTNFLRPFNAALTCVTSARRAVRAAAARRYSLILVDLDSPNHDAFSLARQLRDDGYVGPVIGMAIQTGPDLQAHCVAAEFTGYVSKPITRDGMRGLVASLMDRPLVSSLSGDENLAPLIDRFVEDLRGKVAEMSLAFATSHFDALRSIVLRIRSEAGSYGFDVITETAAYVQALLDAEEPRDRIRRALLSLLHLCLKARSATSPLDPQPDPEQAEGPWTPLINAFPPPQTASRWGMPTSEPAEGTDLTPST